MTVIARISTVAVLLLGFTQCTVPPPGTAVFNGKDNPQEVVNAYHGIQEENQEGYKIIKIQTESIGNPADTSLTYQPARHRPASFK